MRFALFCVFVSSTQLFFSQLFRDEINFVEFKFRVLSFRVLFETLNFLYFVSLFKIQKRETLSTRNNARGFPRDSFEEFASSFEERSLESLFLSLKLHSLKEKPPDFSLNRYTFLSQPTRKTTTLKKRVYACFLQKCA